MAAKQSQITADIFGSTLTLTFADGKSLEVDAMTLNTEIRQMATLHGLKQKLIDAAAIARNTDTGASATLADKYNAVYDVYSRIIRADGTWNKVRGEGGSTAGSRNLLIRALMEHTGKTREKIESFIDSKTKEEVAALRKNEKIATIIARIQSATSDIDTDGLLDELEEDETAESESDAE